MLDQLNNDIHLLAQAHSVPKLDSHSLQTLFSFMTQLAEYLQPNYDIPDQQINATLQSMLILLVESNRQDDFSNSTITLWRTYVPMIRKYGSSLPTNIAQQFVTLLDSRVNDSLDIMLTHIASDMSSGPLDGNFVLFLWFFVQRLAASILRIPIETLGNERVLESLRRIFCVYGIVVHSGMQEISSLRGNLTQVLHQLLLGITEGAPGAEKLPVVMGFLYEGSCIASHIQFYSIIGLKTFACQIVQQQATQEPSAVISPHHFLLWIHCALVSNAKLSSSVEYSYTDTDILRDIQELSSSLTGCLKCAHCAPTALLVRPPCCICNVLILMLIAPCY